MKPKGWRRESRRHAMASKGIDTDFNRQLMNTNYIELPPTIEDELDRIGFLLADLYYGEYDHWELDANVVILWNEGEKVNAFTLDELEEEHSKLMGASGSTTSESMRKINKRVDESASETAKFLDRSATSTAKHIKKARKKLDDSATETGKNLKKALKVRK